MIELTEEQETYLSQWIDREFMCIASSLFGLIFTLRPERDSTHWKEIEDLHDNISHISSTPQLSSFLEREATLEELNFKLENLEDSEDPDDLDTLDAIDNLQVEIDVLRDPGDFFDSNPPGEMYNAWIISNHAGTCPHWKSIMDVHRGSVVPIVEIGGIYFWINMEYSLSQCDWLRILVREYLCPRS